MGLLDSVIGALSGLRSSTSRGDMLGAVLGLLADDSDGLRIDGLAERFERGGMGQVLQSWIGCGPNLPISPEDLQRVLGNDTVDQVAQQLGLSRRVTADRLSQMLPYVIDKLTPQGQVPEEGLGDMGELMGRMAGG
jgi:uncharacterized protein YidB (DUF937 family)